MPTLNICKGNNSNITDAIFMKLSVYNHVMIYIYFKCHEIMIISYLAMAHFDDFQSIQGNNSSTKKTTA